MKPKGIENAEIVISACRKTLTFLGCSAKTEWREVLESVAGAFEELKNKFYLKTNLASPITNACRRDAAELEDLAARGDLTHIPEVLDRFRGKVEKLLRSAKMEGIIIT
jgi:hypothetical protein